MSQQNRIVYVKIDERLECVEFDSNTSSDDLKETLRSAAEANQNDVLKLYNFKGNLVTISNTLQANNPKEPYRLQVIVKNIIDYNNDIRNLIDRIEHLEFQLHSFSTKKVDDLNHKVKELCQKLENLEHLSFLGLFKDTRFYTLGESLKIPSTITTTTTTTTNNLNVKNDKKEKSKLVYEQFKKYSLSQVSEETRQYLRKPSFDNWKFDDAEMLLLLQQIFIDLDLLSKFSIKIETLQTYLFEVYSNYNDVPFHNFRHAFVVTQMMYGLIWTLKLFNYLEPLEILALIVSAISHDLDHDGFNNSFQINAQTHLALIYNDNSPLEMYHCAVAFHILSKPNCNILSSLDRQSYKKFREYVIQTILATDMGKHNQILGNFIKIVAEFDFKNQEHRIELMKILMKTSDISNECRPVNVSELWLDCLLAEFFNQGDHEKLNGLPLTPLMDRNNFSKSKSQIGFISYVLLPLAESLAKLFPQINSSIITPIKESLDYYKKKDSQNNGL